MYKEYAPHPHLSRYVETYWKACGFAVEHFSQRILPDGCGDILFTLHKSNPMSKMEVRKPYIVGTMTTFDDIYYSGEICIVGIRFNPVGITAFTKTPLNELTDNTIDFICVDSIFDASFYQQISDLESIEEILCFFDFYFLSKLASLFEVDKRVEYAVALMKQSKGLISIPTVAQESCLSVRQLERKFNAAIGVSPKMYSRIIKFRNVCNYLKINPEYSLSETAIDCGYTDYSHLIKNFQSFAGYSPKRHTNNKGISF